MPSTKHAMPRIADTPPDALRTGIYRARDCMCTLDYRDVAIGLIAATGLRPTEVCGLSWGDFNDYDGIVSAAFWYGNGGEMKRLPIGSERFCALAPDMADIIRVFRRRQAAYYRRYAPELAGAQDSIDPTAPLVANPLGDRTLPRTLSRWWHSRRNDLGLEGWTLSDLRRATMAVRHADGEDRIWSQPSAMTGLPILPPFPEGGLGHAFL